MSKVFTAQEMRQRANEEEHLWHDLVTAAMLRQAADALERNKKYEYAAKYANGFVSELHSSTIGGTEYAKDSKSFVGVVRREVGEWEEVKDGRLGLLRHRWISVWARVRQRYARLPTAVCFVPQMWRQARRANTPK